jgi:hypothetical protein
MWPGKKALATHSCCSRNSCYETLVSFQSCLESNIRRLQEGDQTSPSILLLSDQPSFSVQFVFLGKNKDCRLHYNLPLRGNIYLEILKPTLVGAFQILTKLDFRLLSLLIVCLLWNKINYICIYVMYI